MSLLKRALQATESAEQRYHEALKRFDSGQRDTKPYESDFGIHSHQDAPGVVATSDRPPLLPWQHEAVDFIMARNGSGILAHATGSGKTRSGVEAVESLRKAGLAGKTLVVTPASLRHNFAQEGVHRFSDAKASIIGSETGDHVRHYTDPDPDADYHVVSYDIFRDHPEEILRATGANTLVLDEMHRLKDDAGKTYRAFNRVRPMVRNVIGLTGSIVSTHPTNILQPINVVSAGQHNLGNRQQFDERFIQRAAPPVKTHYRTAPVSINPLTWFGLKKTPVHTVSKKPGEITGWKNQEQLGHELSKWVHYVGPEVVAHKVPKKDVETVRVEMSPLQERLFHEALHQLPPKLLQQIKNKERMNEDEEQVAFNRLIAARQVSNSIHTGGIPLAEAAKHTPKLQKMLDDLEDHFHRTPDGQAIVYTNLISGGADLIAEGLKQRGIPFGAFVGKGNDVQGRHITEDTRQKDVEDYKDGKLKVMLITGAGNEGVSLPNTTFAAQYDSFFNPERVLQAEHRGIRVGGQAHRQPEDRRVELKRYVTVYPEDRSLFGKTKAVFKGQDDSAGIDEWIYDRADRRHNINQMLADILAKRPVKPHSLHEGTKTRTYDPSGRLVKSSALLRLSAVLGEIGADSEALDLFADLTLGKTAVSKHWFHGSPNSNLTVLKPRPSRVLDGERAVFATPSRDVAVSFMAPWHDEDIEHGSYNGQMYMREQYPGAFDKFFKGKGGSIYHVSPDGFERDPRLTSHEGVNRSAVPVLHREDIKDAMEALQHSSFEMMPYGTKAPWDEEKTAAHPGDGQARAKKPTPAPKIGAVVRVRLENRLKHDDFSVVPMGFIPKTLNPADGDCWDAIPIDVPLSHTRGTVTGKVIGVIRDRTGNDKYVVKSAPGPLTKRQIQNLQAYQAARQVWAGKMRMQVPRVKNVVTKISASSMPESLKRQMTVVANLVETLDTTALKPAEGSQYTTKSPHEGEVNGTYPDVEDASTEGLYGFPLHDYNESFSLSQRPNPAGSQPGTALGGVQDTDETPEYAMAPEPVVDARPQGLRVEVEPGPDSSFQNAEVVGRLVQGLVSGVPGVKAARLAGPDERGFWVEVFPEPGCQAATVHEKLAGRLPARSVLGRGLPMPGGCRVSVVEE